VKNKNRNLINKRLFFSLRARREKERVGSPSRAKGYFREKERERWLVTSTKIK